MGFALALSRDIGRGAVDGFVKRLGASIRHSGHPATQRAASPVNRSTMRGAVGQDIADRLSVRSRPNCLGARTSCIARCRRTCGTVRHRGSLRRGTFLPRLRATKMPLFHDVAFFPSRQTLLPPTTCQFQRPPWRRVNLGLSGVALRLNADALVALLRIFRAFAKVDTAMSVSRTIMMSSRRRALSSARRNLPVASKIVAGRSSRKWGEVHLAQTQQARSG